MFSRPAFLIRFTKGAQRQIRIKLNSDPDPPAMENKNFGMQKYKMRDADLVMNSNVIYHANHPFPSLSRTDF